MLLALLFLVLLLCCSRRVDPGRSVAITLLVWCYSENHNFDVLGKKEREWGLVVPSQLCGGLTPDGVFFFCIVSLASVFFSIVEIVVSISTNWMATVVVRFCQFCCPPSLWQPLNWIKLRFKDNKERLLWHQLPIWLLHLCLLFCLCICSFHPTMKGNCCYYCSAATCTSVYCTLFYFACYTLYGTNNCGNWLHFNYSSNK